MLEFVQEYLPVIIVGAIIGAFAIVFCLAYAALKKHKDDGDDRERKMSDKEIISRLLKYAKPYWKSFVAVFFTLFWGGTALDAVIAFYTEFPKRGGNNIVFFFVIFLIFFK